MFIVRGQQLSRAAEFGGSTGFSVNTVNEFFSLLLPLQHIFSKSFKSRVRKQELNQAAAFPPDRVSGQQGLHVSSHSQLGLQPQKHQLIAI